MKKTMIFYLVTFLVALTGCATKPANLMVERVSLLAYENYTCKQLLEEAGRIYKETGELKVILARKARYDIIQLTLGVIFPPALGFLEFGDGMEASEYSKLQGQYEGIRREALKRSAVKEEVKLEAAMAMRIEKDEEERLAKAEEALKEIREMKTEGISAEAKSAIAREKAEKTLEEVAAKKTTAKAAGDTAAKMRMVKIKENECPIEDIMLITLALNPKFL